MKTKKRLLSILLSLVMVLGLVPGMSMIVYADDTDTSRHREELTYDSYDWENRPSSLVDDERDYIVNNLFDNNAGTKWNFHWDATERENTNLRISIKFHTNSPVVLKEYELWTGDAVSAGYRSRNPRAWKLEGSNSATGPWNALDTKASGDYLPHEGTKEAVFAVHENTNPYQYYRLTVTEIGKEIGYNPYTGNSCYYIELSEIIVSVINIFRLQCGENVVQ